MPSEEDFSVDLSMVIPSYKETELIACLEHLLEVKNEEIGTEIIVVINYRAEDTQEIKDFSDKQYLEVQEWFNQHQTEHFKGHALLIKDLPFKWAGVGLARKIGMDEAAYRLLENNRKKSVLVAYDADCRCSVNYFESIKNHFQSQPKIAAAGLYFEHDLAALEAQDRQLIISYELHLRTYVNLKRFVGLPFAFQTIGSSMAVRPMDYVAKGGMNKRKAGEDFYFLQKFIEDRRFSEINDLVVYPSSRSSDRVPFGTGRAIENMIKDDQADFTTYSPESFVAIKPLFARLEEIYEMNQDEVETFIRELQAGVKAFLIQQNVIEKIDEAKRNASNYKSFQKRFFQWMNAFRFMKYLHFYRDHHAPNVPCLEALNFLSGQEGLHFDNQEKALGYIRRKDQQSDFWKSIN